MDFKKSCLLAVNLSYDDIFLRGMSENGYGFKKPGLKTGVKNDIFWSERGSGFGEPGGTPPPRIPRSNPPRNTTNQPFP